MQLWRINNWMKWLLGNHQFQLEEKIIPVMPFHAILQDNIRCIPPFVGLISVPKGSIEKMEGTAKRSAQMLGWWSFAPAAATGQLFDCTVGQNTHHIPPEKKNNKKHPIFLWPQLPPSETLKESCSDPPTRRQTPWAQAPNHIHLWQGETPVFITERTTWCLVTFH